jgi:hypothetical protein
MADLALDMLREMAFTGRVLDQDDLADADDPGFAVAGSDLYPGIEIDDVLAAGDHAGDQQAPAPVAGAPAAVPPAD